MPIEIRELVIKVSVDQNNKKSISGIDPNELIALKNKIVKHSSSNEKYF
jgi:hypothetical protein